MELISHFVAQYGMVLNASDMIALMDGFVELNNVALRGHFFTIFASFDFPRNPQAAINAFDSCTYLMDGNHALSMIRFLLEECGVRAGHVEIGRIKCDMDVSVMALFLRRGMPLRSAGFAGWLANVVKARDYAMLSIMCQYDLREDDITAMFAGDEVLDRQFCQSVVHLKQAVGAGELFSLGNTDQDSILSTIPRDIIQHIRSLLQDTIF